MSLRWFEFRQHVLGRLRLPWRWRQPERAFPINWDELWARTPDADRALKRAQRLQTQYPSLKTIASQVVLPRQRQILDCLDSLHTLWHVGGEPLPLKLDILSWLDVGAKDWAVIDAQAAMAKRLAKGARINLYGVELDGARRYPNLRTRAEVAASYAKAIMNYWRQQFLAYYITGDVRELEGSYDVITWTLPFVFEDPHRAWGLLEATFAPEAVLAHVLDLLVPGGLLFVINQGEAERDRQAELLAPHLENGNLRVLAGPIALPNLFIGWKYQRYGWLMIKT